NFLSRLNHRLYLRTPAQPQAPLFWPQATPSPNACLAVPADSFGHDAPLARGAPLRCHPPPAARKSDSGGRPTSPPPPQPCRRQPAAAAPAPRPAGGLLPASPSQQPARAGGRDRDRRAALPPSFLPSRQRAALAHAGTYRDAVQTRPLATAAAEAAGKRRGGRGGAELRRPTRAHGGARPFPPPPPPGAMGWEEKQVRGYPEFVQTAQRYHGRPIFALFCGDKDAEGRSWCPDCVTAEPVVRKELHNMPDESVFIYCLVGDRAYWKDPNNEFRKNLKLTGVPTLLKYGTPQKLVEEECFKAELVRMLFTED
uniref:Thioredoxin domain-containing protein 17 n=8 Tax=Neoaves TaxID=3078114 RepID=A0A8B9NGT0_9AVES